MFFQLLSYPIFLVDILRDAVPEFLQLTKIKEFLVIVPWDTIRLGLISEIDLCEQR
jgi:hypothetical protein